MVRRDPFRVSSYIPVPAVRAPMRSRSGQTISVVYSRKEKLMAILNGKKVIVIGDRDGIPGPAIAECAVSAGAEVVFSSTECFV